MTERVVWKVYRLEFDNGDQYVGITSMDISRRLYRHKNRLSGVNRRVVENLNNKDISSHIRVLSHHVDRASAEEREVEEIGKLTQPLNWHGLPPEKRERLKAGYTGSSAPKHENKAGGRNRCCKCGDMLPFAAFHVDATRTSGLSNRCIECSRGKPEVAEANRNRRFRCRHCREWKPGTAYYRDASRSSGLMSSCKTCGAKRDREMQRAKASGKKASEGYAVFREKVRPVTRPAASGGEVQ